MLYITESVHHFRGCLWAGDCVHAICMLSMRTAGAKVSASSPQWSPLAEADPCLDNECRCGKARPLRKFDGLHYFLIFLYFILTFAPFGPLERLQAKQIGDNITINDTCNRCIDCPWRGRKSLFHLLSGWFGRPRAAVVSRRPCLANSAGPPEALRKDTAMCTWLLEHGASPDTQDRRGRTPLYHAVTRRSGGMGPVHAVHICCIIYAIKTHYLYIHNIVNCIYTYILKYICTASPRSEKT